MGRIATIGAKIAPFVALLVAIGFVTGPGWLPGYPRGSDTWGHLFKAEYLAGQIAASGWFSALTGTVWMPDWYLGDPFRTYYPSLVTNALGPLVAIIGEPFLALTLFHTALVVALAGISFYALSREFGRAAGGFGAVLVTLAPYTLRTLFFEGNLPRSMAMLALPLIALSAERLLAAKGSLVRGMLLGSLAWGFAILSHPQQAVMFALGITIYLVARLGFESSLQLWRLPLALIPIGIGGGLSTPWALPAYSRQELTNIPFLPVEKVDIFSMPLRSIFPAFGTEYGMIAVGMGVFVLALLAAVARPDPRRSAWLLSGFFTVVLALGPAGGLFNLLPGNENLLPERFLNFTAYAFPAAAAGLFPMRRRLRLVRVLIVALIISIDFGPAHRFLLNGDYPADRGAIGEALAAQENDGRVVLLNYPVPNSMDVYFASALGKHSQTGGWALENTPHHVAQRRVLGAADWGPEYLVRLLNTWNVRYAITTGNEDGQRAAELLAINGYQQHAIAGFFTLWVNPSPAAPVQRIPTNSMLVVGELASPLMGTYPFAYEGFTPNLIDFDESYLDRFPVLGLMRFDATADAAQASETLEKWVSTGRTAIVELSGMEQPFVGGGEFMDVDVVRLELNNSMEIVWSDELSMLPTRLSLSNIPGAAWSGAAYRNLDRVYAEVVRGGERHSVLGYKNVGAGRVWFIGLNLLYYAQATSNPEISAAIADLTLDGLDVNRELVAEPIVIEAFQFESRAVSFSYFAEEPSDALISLTYSPRWRASVDGQPIPIINHENLVMLPLAAGVHSVELDYQLYGTLWPEVGLALGFFTAGAGLLGMLGAQYIASRNLGVVVPVRQQQRAQPRAASRPELYSRAQHKPCTNCGFRLSLAREPTPATYPFDVNHCTMCGFTLDDSGFEPGKNMNEPAIREQAIAEWIASQRISKEALLQRLNLESLDDLFEKPEPSDTLVRAAGVSVGAEAAQATADESGRTSTDDFEHEPCPNCHFKLAFSGPPTPKTAPMRVVYCPMCGFSLDDSGFKAGAQLVDGVREAAIRNWMAQEGLDSYNIYDRWGLTMDELFDETN